MGKIKSILLVCTGNSCRSVMAEGLLKKMLKEFGKNDIEVQSCGIGTMDGLAPTDETIEVMKRESVDVSDYRSKKISEDLVKKADLILVMEEAHLSDVIRRVPEAAQKTHLLKKFAPEVLSSHPEGFSIPDPIGRPMKDYEYCLDAIKREIERIAKLL